MRTIKIQTGCGEKSWGVILEIISNHFKDK